MSKMAAEPEDYVVRGPNVVYFPFDRAVANVESNTCTCSSGANSETPFIKTYFLTPGADVTQIDRYRYSPDCSHLRRARWIVMGETEGVCLSCVR